MAGRRSLNVAYLGPEASFSHQAAIDFFQPRSTTAQEQTVSLQPLPSFAALFSAIQNSSPSPQPSTPSEHSPSSPQDIRYDYALLPIENSTNGSVVQVLDLLSLCGLDSKALYPDLEVCAEYYLPVHHCLFVSPAADGGSPSPPGDSDLEGLRNSIRTLYTHPQVWGQCSRFLSHHFSPKEVERIDVGSTSAAAQLVSRQAKSIVSGGVNAAIGSKLAGQRHGLVCLAENIEDEPGQNTTRFFVVRNRIRHRQTARAVDHSAFMLEHTDLQAESRYKSLITFTIPHTKPGALADALAVFKAHGFNLTSIDTRPSRRRNWQYVFFVECEEASPPQGIPRGEVRVIQLLSELGKSTESLRFLGRFVDQLPKKDEDSG